MMKSIDLFSGDEEKIVDEGIFCRHCGNIISGEYYKIGDNYLQANYFDEQDGSDNAYCSKDCLLKSLYVLTVDHSGLTTIDLSDIGE